ncbi:MAG: hypothetical protein M5U08_25420 [Burkholderiales bacterium]|nr:hypothetical protein [Burkholderiales bacterium]
MFAIRRIRDFRLYGLDLVTGRACPYGMRYLFRLSEDGAQHVRNFLGLNIAARTSDTLVDLAKAVEQQRLVTVMLSRETLKSLGIFVMFDVHNCVAVVITPTGELLGCETAVEVEEARSAYRTTERECGVRWRKASLKDRGGSDPGDGLAAA